MNFIWLQDFLALAATGNFSRAAEERHSSQPAFSRRVRALEEWIGADLFDRSSQPARLTDVGEWFVGVAEEMLARVSRLPADARSVADANSATLRIASTHVLSFTFLPRWLRGLESATSVGPVELMSDVLQRCESLMQQGKVQFVLSHSHPQARGVLDAEPYQSTPIGEDELIAVSAPRKDGGPLHRLSAQEKSSVPILGYTDASGLGRIMRAVSGRKQARLSSHVVFTAHLASVLRTMALDGRGVAWLPRTLAEEDIDHGKLVPAAGKDWNVPLEVRLYRDAKPLSRAAEAFWKTAAGQ